MPAIPLFAFDPKIPLKEILDDGGLVSTRSKGRALIARLIDLPEEERGREVDFLVDRLRAKLRKSNPAVLSLDTADNVTLIAGVFASFFWPPARGTFNTMRPIVEALRRLPAIDRMVHAIEHDFTKMRGGNEDLDFLSRVSRVAELRREKI